MLVTPKLCVYPPEKVAEWDAYMKQECGIDNYTEFASPKELRTGVFKIRGFTFHRIDPRPSIEQRYPPLWEYYHKGEDYNKNLYLNAYGVCDNAEQILARCPELETDLTRKYVISLTEVRKDEQEASDGWRWEKWGEYIGTQEPQRDYLYDEPEIESVLVYHIYELTDEQMAP